MTYNNTIKGLLLKSLLLFLVISVISILFLYPIFLFLTSKIDYWLNLEILTYDILEWTLFITLLGFLGTIFSLYKNVKALGLFFSLFFVAWGCSIAKAQWNYDKILTLDKNLIVIMNKNKIGVVDFWGNEIIEPFYDKYLPCNIKGLTNEPSDYICILSKDEMFYILDKDERLMPIEQIRFSDSEWPILGTQVGDMKIPTKGVYAYMLITNNGEKTYYTFFNAYGSFVSSGLNFVISDSYDYSTMLLEISYLPQVWHYYDVNYQHWNSKKVTTMSSPSNEYISLSNCCKVDDNQLVLTSTLIMERAKMESLQNSDIENR